MNKIVKILLLTLIFSQFMKEMNAQSTERFIRIVGTSKQKFNSNGIKIELNISDVMENNRNGVRAMNFDSVYIKFINELRKFNLEEKNLEVNSANISRGYNGFSKSYFIYSGDKNLAEKIAGLKLNGVQLTSVQYTYSNIGSNEVEGMLLNAINDAKRKAKNIADELGLKLGRILNIEDTSGNCCGNIKDSKDAIETIEYHVNITFALNE